MGRKSATGIETKQSHGRSKNSASQKSVVRRSKGEASTVESPVKLPNDWPCRSSSPPRLLNFFETLDDEDDDFGFLGQSDGRSYSSTALKPGPVIQQCSGTDIQLARGAMNVASIKKEKGRYLLLLPGLMSLKTSTQSDSTTNAPAKPASKETSDDAVEENENSEITDMEKDSDKHEDDDAQPSASLAAANNSNAPLLGRLERLNSATPVFRIPFPAESSTEGQDIGSSGGQRMLCFPGTKVETSSKFMILTCKKKQVGGTVKCKDIFSSVIVFGQPHWEKVEGESPNQLVETASEAAAAETSAPFCHYGASARSIDGIGRGKGQSTTRRDDVFVSRRFSREIASSSANTGPPSNPVGKGPGDDSEDEHSEDMSHDSSSDEEYNEKSMGRAKLDTSTSSRRSAPKRQASSGLRSYVTKELSSSDSSVNSQDKDNDKDVSEELQVTSKPAVEGRRTSRSKKPISYVQIDSSESEDEVETTTEKRETTRKPQARTIVSSAMDEGESEDETLPTTKRIEQQKVTKTSGSVRPRSQSDGASSAKVEVLLDSSEDDDPNFAPESKAASSRPKQASKYAGRVAGGKVKKSQIHDDGESIGNDSEYSEKHLDDDSHEAGAIVRRPDRRAASLSRKQIGAKKSEGDANESSSEEYTANEDSRVFEVPTKKPARGRSRKTGAKSRGSSSILERLEIEGDENNPNDDVEHSVAGSKRKSQASRAGNVRHFDKSHPKKRSRTSTTEDIEKSARGPASTSNREDTMSDENSRAIMNVEDKDVGSASSRPTKARKTKQGGDEASVANELIESTAMLKTPSGSRVAPATTATPGDKPSPFRSRRRKSPGIAAKSPSKVLDLTGDGDSFNFLS